MSTKNQSKGTPIDKEIRKETILKLLAEGLSRLEIQNKLKEEYGVSQSTLNSDFLNALAELKNNQEPFLSEIKSVIADRYENLWQAAMSRNDLKTAATVLKQMTSLFGLDAPTKVEVDAGDFKISFE